MVLWSGSSRGNRSGDVHTFDWGHVEVELVVAQNSLHVFWCHAPEGFRVEVVQGYKILTLGHHLVQLADKTALV